MAFLCFVLLKDGWTFLASLPLERIHKAGGRNIGIIAKDKFVEDFEGELWEMGIESQLV